MTAVYQLKPNGAFDVYSDEAPFDFPRLKAEGNAIGIMKATQGKFYQSSNFAQVMQGIASVGMFRGCYHFFERDHSAEQAQNFIDFTNANGGIGELPPILDLEYDPTAYRLRNGKPDPSAPSGAKLAAQVKEILDMFEAAFGKKPIIYTSPYFWGYAQNPDWTPQYQFWVADYFNSKTSIDGYPSIPDSFIPKGILRSQVVMWQYTPTGRTDGYAANDYDWVDPNFLVSLGQPPVPGPSPIPQPPPQPQPQPQPQPGPVTTFDPTKPDATTVASPFANLVSIENRTYSVPRPVVVHLIKIPLTMPGLKFMVMPHANPGMVTPVNAMTVVDFLKAYRPQKIAINGDQFRIVDAGKPTAPSGTAATQGDMYVKNSFEDTLYIGANNSFSTTRPAAVYNAISFNHTLVQNSVSTAGLDNSQVTPRTGIAWTGSLVYLVLVDGIEGQSGLTLLEFGLLMNSLGVTFAVNMDGGGSTSGAMHLPDGTFPLINTPSDNNVAGTLRPLGSILGVSW